MVTIGNTFGDKDSYLNEQFSHLFRLSSALWSFNKGKLSPEQQLQYDKIVNLGVYEQKEGFENYDEIVKAVKGSFKIGADHTFSTTGDRYRIWLLNYAAALPVYVLSDLDQSKNRYEEEISPTYHIDGYLEMNVPDLFPPGVVDNIALRVLGMAIVPGIDVIHDEKLQKGHLFTCDAEAVKATNFGDPKIWRLFREMYDEVKNEYNPDRTDNLLDILSEVLKAKVESLSTEELKTAINSYIDKVMEKMAKRDFTRLISARLTYREIRELKKFLTNRNKGGYGMEIERYINGS
jgi:hypothetical protein